MRLQEFVHWGTGGIRVGLRERHGTVEVAVAGTVRGVACVCVKL